MILVFGSKGQLGKRMCQSLESFGLEFCSLSRDDFDFEDIFKVRNSIAEIKPEVILNCVGYTNVAMAEKEREKAMYLNAVIPRVLCEEQKKHFGCVIHFSTDYVFDGEKDEPYLETDIPSPVNYYGYTKLEGENLVKASRVPYLIFRIGWVYSSDDTSFVMRISKKLAMEDEAKVVVDQVGTPNSADWVAFQVCNLLYNHKIDICSFVSVKKGIYHLSASGRCSWYDFALKISSIIPRTNNKVREVGALFSNDGIFGKLKRPLFSVLNNQKSKLLFRADFPDWEVLFRETMTKHLESMKIADKKIERKLIIPPWQEEKIKPKKRKRKWRSK